MCRSPSDPGLAYYLLNKPAGVVSTAPTRRAGRPSPGLVPPEPRVTPSAAWTPTARVCCCSPTTATSPTASPIPASAWKRSTSWRSQGTPNPGALRRLREGVDLEDGPTAPARVSAWCGVDGLRITIHEGRNRQVRRMCEAVGHPVRRLVRTRIGPIRVGTLAPGQWRELTPGGGPGPGAGRRTLRGGRDSPTSFT